MIKIGTKVMILSGVDNPDNIGKVGIVQNFWNEGWTDDEDGDEFGIVETLVIVVDVPNVDGTENLETLYDIHNDYEVIES